MIKRTLLAFAIAALASTSAHAQVLWQGVEAGMTKEQVQALHPTARVRGDRLEIPNFRPLDDCSSTVRVKFKNNGVDEVEVRGAASLSMKCAESIGQALLARYGRPVEEDVDQNRILGVPHPIHNAYWHTDGVVMRFARYESNGLGGPAWTMQYKSLDQIEDSRRSAGEAVRL